jgi:site-specific DNA-methyltransferase (adenine-specific)
MSSNLLYYGDNLDILCRYVEDESVDLIYLDPPFKSNQDYNVLFEEQDGSRAAAQIKAFEDTWHWDSVASFAYQQMVEAGGKVSEALQAFRQLLGANDMLAYLTMMAPRLVELRRKLRPTGSIYLHCDPTASHYLKVLLDSIFGPDRFLNEIVWQRTSSHNDPSRYGRIHDSILFYSKTDNRTWAQQYESKDAAFFEAHDFVRDEDGRLYRKRDLTAPSHGRETGRYAWKGKTPPAGRMWSFTEQNMLGLEAEGRIVYTKTGMPRMKIYAEDLKGAPFQDVWAKPELWLNSAAKERLGYQTQKPETILERIILSSSNEGDTVLDPFCGCGTAIAVAQRLGRRWVGIDITHLAITLIRHRLLHTYGDKIIKSYQVVGEPVSLPDAEALAKQDRYQFQWWALGLVGARPVPTDEKKGADKGIDGKLFFHDDPQGGKTKQIIFSVKSGGTSVRDVRDLRGVVEREKAAIGCLIALETPTRPMYTEATEAGFYVSPWGGQKFPRLQVLTIEGLLAGERIIMPPHENTLTFKRPPKAKPTKIKQGDLFDKGVG